MRYLSAALAGVCACAVSAGAVQFTFGGDLQYRFRYETSHIINQVNDTLRYDSLKSDYTNRYMWNVQLPFIKTHVM